MRDWLTTKLPRRLTRRFLAELDEAVRREDYGAVRFAEAHRAALIKNMAQDFCKMNLNLLSDAQLATIGQQVSQGIQAQLRFSGLPKDQRVLQEVMVNYLNVVSERLRLHVVSTRAR